jgi:hypothetical protein
LDRDGKRRLERYRGLHHKEGGFILLAIVRMVIKFIVLTETFFERKC